MRLQPRALFALALPVACFCGSYACSSTFPNKLNFAGDAGESAPAEDSSVPVDAADAQALGDAGDGGHAGDAGGKADADAGDAASVTDGTAPSDAGDAGLEDGALDDASDLDGSATG
jgi:hypothetical protein